MTVSGVAKGEGDSNHHPRPKKKKIEVPIGNKSIRLYCVQ